MTPHPGSLCVTLYSGETVIALHATSSAVCADVIALGAINGIKRVADDCLEYVIAIETATLCCIVDELM